MGTFRNSVLSLIDSSAQRAKNLVDIINDTFEKIDFDSSMNFLSEKRDSLIERGNSLLKEFGDLLKQVKDSFNDFSVTVPFDESIGETLNYYVDGNKLYLAMHNGVYLMQDTTLTQMVKGPYVNHIISIKDKLLFCTREGVFDQQSRLLLR